MNKYYVLWTTHYGDDWESTHKEIFATLDEVEEHKIEHQKEMQNVSGIENIEFKLEEKTDKQLREILTVKEYCKLHPELNLVLKQMFG